jgi:hypothetical protein
MEEIPMQKNTMTYYITKDVPFGPIDSSDIDPRDVETLQKLYEQHNRLYRNMRHRPSIIMGRKGSGKTSYLRSVYIDGKYDFIIEVRTDHALTHISKVIQDISQGAMFPEMLAELWGTILWTCVLFDVGRSEILSKDKSDPVNKYLEKVGVQDCVTTDDVLWKLARMFDEVVAASPKDGLSEVLMRMDRAMFKSTVMLVEDSLNSSDKKFVILMDSLDDFQLDFSSVSYSLQGLLKFVGSMNKPRAAVDVRFCLPTELYRRILRISSNPNKDFQHSLKLQWTATELILIGAQRLALYLDLYYPEYFKRLMPLDPSVRADALRLFQAVLPTRITNSSGFQEETISYILRHTQLLPRHFLIILNSIFKTTGGTQGLHPFPIGEKRIINGIRQVEERIVSEIFIAFKSIHPTAESACKRSLPELGHRFSVGELHRVFTRHGKAVFGSDSLFEFERMMMEIGAMGKVIPEKTTEVYIQGNFEYTVEHEISISHNDELCIHPLFSGIFGKSKNELPVYPYGGGLDDEDYRDELE